MLIDLFESPFLRFWLVFYKLFDDHLFCGVLEMLVYKNSFSTNQLLSTNILLETIESLVGWHVHPVEVGHTYADLYGSHLVRLYISLG